MSVRSKLEVEDILRFNGYEPLMRNNDQYWWRPGRTVMLMPMPTLAGSYPTGGWAIYELITTDEAVADIPDIIRPSSVPTAHYK